MPTHTFANMNNEAPQHITSDDIDAARKVAKHWGKQGGEKRNAQTSKARQSEIGKLAADTRWGGEEGKIARAEAKRLRKAEKRIAEGRVTAITGSTPADPAQDAAHDAQTDHARALATPEGHAK